MVFQDYALFPHMTVRENVAFPLTVRKLPNSEVNQRVSAALDMVRLPDFGDRRPAQLSGGQQQRVALARALVFRPRLVLMDEPLGALDRQLREQLQLEIKHIQIDLGITVVYVPHDQQEALTISDRIAVFNDGRVCQIDTAEELYERPQNSFVAHFVGENNRLSGTVVKTDGVTCHVQLEGGSRITATPVNVGVVGEKTLLSVRPERIALGPDEGWHVNSFEARIDELIYQGDATRVRVTFPGSGDDFVVKLPNTGRHLPLEIGATVKIGWTATDCLALDAL